MKYNRFSCSEINFIEDIDSNRLNDEMESYLLSHSRRKLSHRLSSIFLIFNEIPIFVFSRSV